MELIEEWLIVGEGRAERQTWGCARAIGAGAVFYMTEDQL